MAWIGIQTPAGFIRELLTGVEEVICCKMAHPWRDATIATALISSVPTMVLPLIPEGASKEGSGLQRILLCFAVGGMLGDVFLHLLPHLLGKHLRAITL